MCTRNYNVSCTLWLLVWLAHQLWSGHSLKPTSLRQESTHPYMSPNSVSSSSFKSYILLMTSPRQAPATLGWSMWCVGWMPAFLGGGFSGSLPGLWLPLPQPHCTSCCCCCCCCCFLFPLLPLPLFFLFLSLLAEFYNKCRAFSIIV